MLNRSAPVELACAWLGFGVFFLLFGTGFFVLAKFIPPHWPSWTADQVVAVYQSNLLGIRMGMLLGMVAAGFFILQVCLIFSYMRRIETRNGLSSILSSIQLVGGAVTTAVAFLIPAIFFAVAAFRPDRNPELTLLMNDTGWIFLTWAYGSFLPQSVAMGVCFLMDRSPVPLFPRWVGYLCIFDGFTGIGASTVPFFKTGPFAWNGIFPFWMVLTIFGVWSMTMWIFSIKAVKRDVPYEAPRGAAALPA